MSPKSGRGGDLHTASSAAEKYIGISRDCSKYRRSDDVHVFRLRRRQVGDAKALDIPTPYIETEKELNIRLWPYPAWHT